MKYDNYDDLSIIKEEGADKHRARVSQYLGASDINGLEAQLKEFFDNARDEMIEAYNNWSSEEFKDTLGKDLEVCKEFFIDVQIHDNWAVTVADYGRGLPCGIHPKYNEPTPHIIFENDSAGGKNRGGAGYKSGTSGTHGAGGAVSISCSKVARIITKTTSPEGVYIMEYTEGKRSKDLTRIGEVKLREGCQYLKDTGTIVQYEADLSVFTQALNGVNQPYRYRFEELKKYFINSIYPAPEAVKIRFKYPGKEVEIYDRNSLDLADELGCKLSEVTALEIDGNDFEKNPYDMKIYMAAKSNRFNTKLICNGLTVVNKQIDNTIQIVLGNKYDELLSLMQPSPISGRLREGSHRQNFTDRFKCVIALRLTKPEYSGQHKQILSSTNFIRDLQIKLNQTLRKDDATLLNAFKIEFEMAKLSIEQAEIIEKARIEHEKKKEKAEKEKLKKKVLSMQEENLTIEQKIDAELDEKASVKLKENALSASQTNVTIFEGFSAGYGFTEILKENPSFDTAAIYIKGKIDNIVKNDSEGTELLIPFIKMLSKGWKSIRILTDGDADGFHIRVLLLKILYEYFPQYFTAGKIYIIVAPYAKVIFPKDTFVKIDGAKRLYKKGDNFVNTPSELTDCVNAGGIFIEKYNGLGDNKLHLKELLTNPKYLLKVENPNEFELDKLTDVLSTKSEHKRQELMPYLTDRTKIEKLWGVNKDIVRLKFTTEEYQLSTTPNKEDMHW